MQSSDMPVAPTLHTCNLGFAVFGNVGRGCTTMETYRILLNVFSPFLERFFSKASTFVEGMRLLMDRTVF